MNIGESDNTKPKRLYAHDLNGTAARTLDIRFADFCLFIPCAVYFFLSIFRSSDNIHAIRNSLDKLKEITSYADSNATTNTSYYASNSVANTGAPASVFLSSSSSAPLAFDETFLSKLENSLWIHYV